MGQKEGGPQEKSTRRGMWTWGKHPTWQVRKEGAGKARALCGSRPSNCAFVRPALGAGSGARLACFNKCYHCPNGWGGGWECFLPRMVPASSLCLSWAAPFSRNIPSSASSSPPTFANYSLLSCGQNHPPPGWLCTPLTLLFQLHQPGTLQSFAPLSAQAPGDNWSCLSRLLSKPPFFSPVAPRERTSLAMFCQHQGGDRASHTQPNSLVQSQCCSNWPFPPAGRPRAGPDPLGSPTSLSLIPLRIAQEDFPQYQQSEIRERMQQAQDMEAKDCFSNFHM